MNMKKWLALLLCLLLTLSLAGCSGGAPAQTEEPEITGEETESSEQTETGQEPDYQALYDAALAAVQNVRGSFDPDMVVCTIDGVDITWGMYYYFIAEDLQDVLYYIGDLPTDFNEKLTETSTMSEYFNKSALSKATYYAVANAMPERLGVPFADQAETAINEQWNRLLERYGSEEALTAAMGDAGLDKDLLFFFLRSNEGLNAVQKATYGEEAFPDEDVLSWAGEKGYVRTKHILYSFYNEDGSAMDDEGKAAQKARADEVWAELDALKEDTAALEASFDELMNAESGDAGGLSNFPAGYTFASGTMVPAYEAAAFELEDYGLSGVVETDYGYHILLRLPLDAGGLTMDQNSSTGAYMTLRETAANDKFNEDLAKWIEEATVEWRVPELENIDFNALFGIVPEAKPDDGE